MKKRGLVSLSPHLDDDVISSLVRCVVVSNPQEQEVLFVNALLDAPQLTLLILYHTISIPSCAYHAYRAISEATAPRLLDRCSIERLLLLYLYILDNLHGLRFYATRTEDTATEESEDDEQSSRQDVIGLVVSSHSI